MSQSLDEMRKCVARELAMRCNVYPKWIESGKMKGEAATHEIETMRSVDTLLRTITEPEMNSILANQELPLYQHFVAAYSEFIKGRGSGGLLFNGRDGKVMKEIYAKLKTNSQAKTDEGALKSWTYILTNWNKLNDFLQSQITVVQINKNLLEIIDKLRNGKATNQTGNGTKAAVGPGTIKPSGGLWGES